MRMPTCLVMALLTMQPRLEAEESIAAANRVAMGSGKLQAADATRIAQAWARSAHGPDTTPVKPDAGVLMAAGFAVRRVKTIPKTK